MNKKFNDREGKGLDGENWVRKELGKLPPAFYPNFDFMDGKHGNTDAVVIGPTGIWTIEVKNISWTNIDHDKFLGNKTKQTSDEARNMENHLKNSLGLSLQVNPVLVFANPKSEIQFGLNKQHGVFVIGIKDLLGLLQNPKLGSPLDPETCVRARDEIKKYTSLI